MKTGDRLCVVMPVYNEQDSIGPVLEKWSAAFDAMGLDYEIRPYNDGSRDGSLAVMQKVAAVNRRISVRDKPNGGHGNTVLVGYREAANDGFDWVFQVDSDDEMQPDGFYGLWARRKDFDFLVGARDGRVQPLSRRIVSFVSRLCTRLFYGKGIWDVNTPYRLMRISAMRSFFFGIPLTTFAPNVILSGLVARHSLRCFEAKVPQRDRTTGEVSIKKWKLLCAAAKSLFQTLRYAVCEPNDGASGSGIRNWRNIGLAWLAAVAAFAYVPDTFANWNYNYLSFLPISNSVAIVAMCALILAWPSKRFCPSLFKCPVVRWISLLTAIVGMSACFWVFRTRVHCFCGDGCVGTVPQDLSIGVGDFVPAMPLVGRLDGWGMGLLTKLLLRHGMLDSFTGMTAHFSAQVYSVLFGCVYVLLTAAFFRRKTGALCALLTLPFVFNFFGNLDCYAFSLCVAVAFAASVVSCEGDSRGVRLGRLAVAVFMWFIGLWAHPFFLFGGFLLIRPTVAFVNGVQRKFAFDRRILEWMYAVVLFVAISFSQHAKPFFEWTLGQRPPVFSLDTLTHLVNVLLLPSVPLAVVAWSCAKRRDDKADALRVFLLMTACFLPLGFTQGANDQFPYMHLFFFFSIPWISVLCHGAASAAACRFLLSANLFLLVPMVVVHCTERTVDRAERLYPLDPCKHNREMSWQTHLGLLLGDNMVDSRIVKSATLRTFSDGARHAEPSGFRGGNYIYHTAFLYHFGEFSEGRRQLFSLLDKNPETLRWFMSVRPGFIYLNRKALWDDIDLFLLQKKSPLLGAYRSAVADLRKKAMQENYCIKRPCYAMTEY